MRKPRTVHGPSLIWFLIFCNKIVGCCGSVRAGPAPAIHVAPPQIGRPRKVTSVQRLMKTPHGSRGRPGRAGHVGKPNAVATHGQRSRATSPVLPSFSCPALRAARSISRPGAPRPGGPAAGGSPLRLRRSHVSPQSLESSAAVFWLDTSVGEAIHRAAEARRPSEVHNLSCTRERLYKPNVCLKPGRGFRVPKALRRGWQWRVLRRALVGEPLLPLGCVVRPLRHLDAPVWRLRR
jgi:hypothetical protein